MPISWWNFRDADSPLEVHLGPGKRDLLSLFSRLPCLPFPKATICGEGTSRRYPRRLLMKLFPCLRERNWGPGEPRGVAKVRHADVVANQPLPTRWPLLRTSQVSDPFSHFYLTEPCTSCQSAAVTCRARKTALWLVCALRVPPRSLLGALHTT